FGIIPAVRLREILSLQEWNQAKMRLFVRDGLQERIALLASSGRIQKAGALDRLVFLQPVLRVRERPGGGGLDGGRKSNVTQRSQLFHGFRRQGRAHRRRLSRTITPLDVR